MTSLRFFLDLYQADVSRGGSTYGDKRLHALRDFV